MPASSDRMLTEETHWCQASYSALRYVVFLTCGVTVRKGLRHLHVSGVDGPFLARRISKSASKLGVASALRRVTFIECGLV